MLHANSALCAGQVVFPQTLAFLGEVFQRLSFAAQIWRGRRVFGTAPAVPRDAAPAARPAISRKSEGLGTAPAVPREAAPAARPAIYRENEGVVFRVLYMSETRMLGSQTEDGRTIWTCRPRSRWPWIRGEGQTHAQSCRSQRYGRVVPAG